MGGGGISCMDVGMYGSKIPTSFLASAYICRCPCTEMRYICRKTPHLEMYADPEDVGLIVEYQQCVFFLQLQYCISGSGTESAG